MSRFALVLGILSLTTIPLANAADQQVFSGPQAGENLPPLVVAGVLGSLEGKDFDCVAEADGAPMLLVFMHERTRPAFGLIRAITRFSESKAESGMKTYVVYLSDDPTKDAEWARGIVGRLFGDKVVWAISKDGVEGPGPYGLNRNVTLTVLVAKEGKATANWALVQPQLQADGPAILNAIAAVTGGGKVPSVNELMAEGMRMQGRAGAQARGGDAKLGSLLRAMINRRAEEAQVREAAKQVEDYIAENESAKRDLTRRVRSIVDSGNLQNYGSQTAQEILKEWRRKLVPDAPAE